jgi:TRAP-type C4-dicarboxylate transport system substrate-binding protein
MRLHRKWLALAAALATAVGFSQAALAIMALRSGTVLAPDEPMEKGLEKFKVNVESATGGEATRVSMPYFVAKALFFIIIALVPALSLCLPDVLM